MKKLLGILVLCLLLSVNAYADSKFDKDLKKIIVRRDKDKYPIVRFSLFNKLAIEQGSVIKSVEGNDLSTLSDDKLNAIFLQNINFGTLRLELKNGNKININRELNPTLKK